MKIFALALTLALAVAVTADNCVFDPQAACDKCSWDNSWVQYVADGCDRNKYYMCEKRNGYITAHQQRCGPCLGFSDEKWTCSIRISDVNCSTYAPVNIQPIPQSDAFEDFFCVDFDQDTREKAYYDVDQSCYITEVDGAIVDSYSAYGNGLFLYGWPCHVEIPYFQNNQFSKFTLCGMFNWFDWIGQIQMGLAYNGYADDCYPGSIKLLLTDKAQVKGSIQTTTGFYNYTFELTHPYTVAPWVWHKVCLKYDSVAKKLSLKVDNQPAVTRSAKGIIAPKKCNMRLGEVLESTAPNMYDSYSFIGLMDSWCFSPKMVNEYRFATYDPVTNIMDY